MSCDRPCSGGCCAVFTFLDTEHPRFAGIEDADYLRDMLIPLDLIAAAERLDSLGLEPYWVDDGGFGWDGFSVHDPTRRLMTCRHWDTTTRLCTAYEARPHMCREYPYERDNCDYMCGYSRSHEQEWDRALRIGGSERGTPPNITRGDN